MPLRDLALFGVFAVFAPMIVARPYLGALAWVVFGLLNPHRFTFGPAYNFPFSLIIAILTVMGLFLTRDHRQLKGGAAGVVLVAFMVWMMITTYFALTQPDATEMWWRVTKMLFMTFVIMSVLHTRRHAELLAALIALSIGFFAIKGGIFTILGHGEGRVNGPDGSVMEGNNALAVAMVMTLPLVVHFYQQARKRWLRLALAASMPLFAASILGSYSRGALLALVGMGVLLFIRSSHKVLTLAVLVATATVLVPMMPDQWEARMNTIETYQQDSSAMGRIYAWQTAANIAKDRLFGAGFEYPSLSVMARYSPTPDVLVAHSIYFQTLGEHGFFGLGLFVVFWTIVWWQCSSTRRLARKRADFQWAFSLMSMTQVSLVGYAVGGAFLNIAFWDMPYYLYALIIVTRHVLVQAGATTEEVTSHRAASPAALYASSPASVNPGLPFAESPFRVQDEG